MTNQTHKEPASRRYFLGLSAILGIGATGFALTRSGAADAKTSKKFEITKSEAQWRKQLTDQEFYVLRKEGTERPYSSALNAEKRAGTYSCAACNLALFLSKTKFESGTGWPSFYAPIKNAVGTASDYKLGLPRTEVHCRRCGGHLGHVFNDGPKPTGKRYCMNGGAMDFRAA